MGEWNLFFLGGGWNVAQRLQHRMTMNLNSYFQCIYHHMPHIISTVFHFSYPITKAAAAAGVLFALAVV